MGHRFKSKCAQKPRRKPHARVDPVTSGGSEQQRLLAVAGVGVVDLEPHGREAHPTEQEHDASGRAVGTCPFCSQITHDEPNTTAQAVNDAREKYLAATAVHGEGDHPEVCEARLKLEEGHTAHTAFLRAQAFQRQVCETERSTAHFFRPLSTDLTRCPMDEAVLEDVTLTRTQLSVQDAHQRHWGKIFGDDRYSTPEDISVDPIAQENLLHSITRKITTDMREKLDGPITEVEVITAIKSMARNKAPGADGLPSELYQFDPTRFAKILKIVFDAQRERGTMLPHQRKSIITLLHKSGPRSHPANYRPISLIPVDVKILSRVLTSRLRHVLPHVIHPDQRGFVAGRHIHHSLLMLTDLREHVTGANEETYATFIDVEKAFDRVNWNYMWKVLETMGFGSSFIQWCRLLYHKSNVRLNINGWYQDPLYPGRGVKQGDPLSAMLFVLTIEPLTNLIRANPHLGYTAQGQSVATGSFFADDSLLLSNSVTDVEAQLDLVQIYCRGSGAKLNISKTKILALNRNQEPIRRQIFHFLEPTESCKYLGLPFGQQVFDEDRVAHINSRFFETLTKWRWRARTLHGRRLLAYSVVLSQLLYTTAVTAIPSKYIKTWQRMIDNYILRAVTEPNDQRLIIGSSWLYHKNQKSTLRIPHINTIVKRQRIRLLVQVAQRHPEDTGFSWIHMQAPLWLNRHPEWQYQPPTTNNRICLLPSQSDANHEYRLLVCSTSQIYCLQDILTSNNEWPAFDVFHQRVVLDFAASMHTPRPTTLPTDPLPLWPWTLANTSQRERFPNFKPKMLYQHLLPSTTRKKHHPITRHGQPGTTVTLLTNRTPILRKFISPVCFDVRFRAWWRVLPVGYLCWSSVDPNARYCTHGCSSIETYQHLFFDCRVGRQVWELHFQGWSTVFSVSPTWHQVLLGLQLPLRERWVRHRQAAEILWHMLCSIVMHTLWRSRNDQKHRGERPPPPEILFKTTALNVTNQEDDPLHDQFQDLISTLELDC